MNNEKLYKMVRNYAKSQMKKSKIVASHYDWEDIAQKVFLRYHRCGYEAEHPATYMYLMVRSEIYNQYQKDRIRSYKERPQHKVKLNSEDASVWFSDEEGEWNDSFLCAGPEELLDYRERIEWLQWKGENDSDYDTASLYYLASGGSKNNAWNYANVGRNKFYRNMRALEREYTIQFLTN